MDSSIMVSGVSYFCRRDIRFLIRKILTVDVLLFAIQFYAYEYGLEVVCADDVGRRKQNYDSMENSIKISGVFTFISGTFSSDKCFANSFLAPTCFSRATQL